MNQVHTVDHIMEDPREAARLDIAKLQMAKAFGGSAEAKEQIRRFLEYLSKPDRLTYSVQFTVTGEKPLLNAMGAWPSKNQRNSRRLVTVAPRRH